MRHRILEIVTTIIGVGVVWALAGCAPTGPVRYEEDPGHYPYYRPLRNEGEVGFYPRTDPGVVVGGSRNGSVVHNGRVYNEDGSMDYLRR